MSQQITVTLAAVPALVTSVEIIEDDYPVLVGYAETQPSPGTLSLSNFVVRETPFGLVDGSNSTFILAHTPLPGTETVYLNGILQHNGMSMDYTINGNTISFNGLSVPVSGDVLLVSYIK